MMKTSLKKSPSKKEYYQEIIVKPAQKLLCALQEAQSAPVKPKIKKSATSK